MIHVRRRIFSSAIRRFFNLRPLSTKSIKHGDDEWNNAWESAWLPDDLSSKNRAPWETDVNFSLSSENNNNNENENENENPSLALQTDVDAETKAFVEDMTDNWEQRRKSPKFQQQQQEQQQKDQSSLYSLENVKKDYRLTKQRIHAGLWMKEIEKQEEAKLGDTILGGSDDIERLLDSCSEIFDTADNDMNKSKKASSEEVKNKPDGWESTSKGKDGNIWEMSQREEDILVQEFERRIAFSKFQIASFIKTHIFSRRRPIDGWKYMIEELGPNARKGKGTLSDPSTQPFKQDNPSNRSAGRAR